MANQDQMDIKYRYSVLKGDIQNCYRTLLIQVCDVKDIEIFEGVVSNDQVHMHLVSVTD